MKKLTKHIFICEFARNPKSDKPSCGQAAMGYKRHLKEKLNQAGMAKNIRINGAGCIGVCEHGPAMVIYPKAVWYGNIKEEDLDTIFKKSIINNEEISALKIEGK